MAPSSVVVQSVWASNLHREFIRIRQALEVGYTQATLDAEFYLGPSCSKITTHPHFLSPEKRYDDIRTRVDGGRGIRQLGLTLSPSIYGDDGSLDLVWEFNFGPNRKKGQGYGEVPINYDSFSFLLHSSGLLCNPDITWVFFHSAYDIAFFIKLATFSSPLPLSLPEFSSTVDALLGGRHHIFDIKFIMRFTNDLFGGLAAVSTALGVKRLSGQAREAGSDSLLTWHVYKRMIHVYFPIGNATRHAGLLYGIDCI